MNRIACICLTASILIFQVNTTSYTIDSSLASSSSPFFKSLEDAVPYITNSGTISGSIIVTLMNTTVGIDQTLPNFNIYGGGTGGVDIIYANTPSMVSSSSDCDLLPSIVLSQSNSNSVLAISNIDHFSFTGINLKVVADSYSNYFTDVSNVTLNNVCMANSDPSPRYYSTQQLLSFGSIKLLNFTNLVMTQNSTGTIYVNSSNLVMQSWQLIMLPLDTSAFYQAIVWNKDDTGRTSTSITNLSVTCDSWTLLNSTQAVRIEYASFLNITNVKVFNCYFGTSVNSNPLFMIRYVSQVVLEQFTFSHLSFSLLSDNSVNGYFGILNSLNLLINNITFQNHTSLSIPDVGAAKNIGFTCIGASWVHGFESNYSLVQNILLINSILVGTGAIVYYNSLDSITPLLNVNANNNSIINTYLSYGIGFEIQPQRYSTRVTINSVTFYTLTNLQVINSTINETMLISFVSQDSDETDYVLDMWSFEVNNFTLIGNYFTSIGVYDPLEMMGTQVRITNMYASNNTLSGSLFMTAPLRMSTFTMVNSTINGLTLDNNSYFIGYTLFQSDYTKPEPGYYNLTSNQYLAETRPFSVINTTFSNVMLLRASYLIYSCNPMIILVNNVFSNISSSGSTMIVFGQYIPPAIKPSGYSYANSSAVEQKIFANYLPVLQTFTSMRDLISSYNPNNEVSVFFVGFQNNSFQNVTSINEQTIISLSDMIIDTESLGYFNTSFSNINITTSQDFSLFSFSELNQLYFATLTCSNVSGTGRIIGVSSTSINKLSFDLLSFNVITETSAFQIVSSICANMIITNGVSNNVLVHGPWIDISCYTETSQMMFVGNSFSNINVTAITEELSPINFFLLQIQQALSGSTPNILFTNNNFTNISLNKTDQGFAQDVYSSQMISLTLSDSTTTFTQNRFENLTNIPNDNILTVSALNISFVDCFFKNLTQYELSGAIYLVFNNLEVDGTIFQENTGNNSNGGGLLTLINPNSDGSSINATFSNCTFARNSAVTSSIIQFRSKSLNLILQDSILMDNSAVSSGSIFLYQLQQSTIILSNVTFKYLYFKNNTSKASTYTVLEVQEAQGEVDIQVNNCNLQVNGPFYGDLISVNQSQNTNLLMNNFIYNQSQSLSPIVNLTLDQNQPHMFQQGNPSYSVLHANRIKASLNNISIQQINTNQKPLFIMECLNNQQNIYFGSLSINSSSFSNMNNTESLISITPHNLQPANICQIYISIVNSSFSNITGSGIEGTIIHSSTYQIGRSSSNDSASDIQYTALSVANSSFQNISAVSGSIYYSQRLFENSAAFFQNNSFNNISATSNGGAFFIEAVSQQQQQASSTSASARRLDLSTSTTTTVDLSRAESYIFQNNNFQSISAQNGGVFYSPAPNGEASTINLFKNTFSNISVQQRGSILYLNNHTVNATSNQFISSYAGVSGTIIYSLSDEYDPQQLKTSNTLSPNITSSLQPLSFGPNYLDVQVIASFPIEIIDTNTISNSNNTSTGSSTFLVTNISSYSLQQISIVTTLKYQNDIISQKVIDTGDSSSFVQFTFEGTFFGSKKALGQYCSESVCYLNQSDLILVGLADSIIDVSVFYSSINPSTNTNYNASTIFSIQLRSCMPGEINKTISGSCEYCTNGTYSLSPSDESCSPCPLGANCLGGSYIVLDSGYWRNATNSNLIVPCNDSGARCLGGYDTNCSDHYIGPICSQCDVQNGYLPSNGNCVLCQSKSQMVLTAVAVLIGLLIYQGFVIVTTYKDLKKSYLEIISADQLSHDKVKEVKTEDPKADDHKAEHANAEDHKAEDPKADDHKAEHANAEDHKAEDHKVEDAKAGDPKAEHANAEDHKAEDHKAEDAKAGDAKAGDAKAGDAKAGDAKAGDAKAGDAKAGDAKAGDAKAGDAKAGDAKAGDAKAGDAKAGDAKAGDAKAGDAKAQDAKVEHAKADDGGEAAEYLVIFTTYSQISSVISALNVGYVSNFFSITLPLANPSQQALFSVGCLAYLQTMDLFSMLKLKILWFVFSPFVKLLVICFLEIIRAIIKRKEQQKRKKALLRLGLCCMVLVLLEQPGIVSALCMYLSCTSLNPYDSTRYIAAVNNIQCGTDEYNSFRNVVVVPSLTFWGFAVPLAISLILYKNRQNLYKSETIRLIFGSLYSHYSKKAYFWGLMIMVFKITLFTLNSLLQVSDLVKQTIFLFVVYIYFWLSKYFDPHVKPDLKKADSYITQSFLWSLYFVIIKDTFGIEDLSVLGVITNLLILVANGLPVGYLLLKLAVIYFRSFKELFKKFKAWTALKRKTKKQKNKNLIQTKKIFLESDSTLKNDDSKILEDHSLQKFSENLGQDLSKIEKNSDVN